jgi:hypothetical protein
MAAPQYFQIHWGPWSSISGGASDCIFSGADETWTCFTSEFSPGGLIDAATTEEQDLA